MDDMKSYPPYANTPYDRACDDAQAARERRAFAVQSAIHAAEVELERRLHAAKTRFAQIRNSTDSDVVAPYLDACDVAWVDFVKTRDALLHGEEWTPPRLDAEVGRL